MAHQSSVHDLWYTPVWYHMKQNSLSVQLQDPKKKENMIQNIIMDINIRRYFSILLHIGLYAGKHKRIF
jgi:hypothetical protein